MCVCICLSFSSIPYYYPISQNVVHVFKQNPLLYSFWFQSFFKAHSIVHFYYYHSALWANLEQKSENNTKLEALYQRFFKILGFSNNQNFSCRNCTFWSKFNPKNCYHFHLVVVLPPFFGKRVLDYDKTRLKSKLWSSKNHMMVKVTHFL